jgi:hypothetical protein
LRFWNVLGRFYSMTRTFQKPDTTLRRDFFGHAAELYGVTLDAALVEAAEHLDDLDAVALLFPCLDDAERQEALWALGHFGG